MSSTSPIPWPAAKRPWGRCSSCRSPRRRSSPRPTSSPSASSMRRTTWASGSSPTSCRSSASTTSRIAAHTVPALTTLRMPIAEIVGEAVGVAIELARTRRVARRRGLKLRAVAHRAQSTRRRRPPVDGPPPGLSERGPSGRRSRRRPVPGGRPGSRPASPRPSGWPRRRYGDRRSARSGLDPDRVTRSPHAAGGQRSTDRVPAAGDSTGSDVGSSSTSSRAPCRPAGRPSRCSRPAARARAPRTHGRRRCEGSGTVTPAGHLERQDDRSPASPSAAFEGR